LREAPEGGRWKAMKTAIHVELPQELVSEARVFVSEGWAGDFDEVLADALRRYLESHSSRLAENFVREDVEWGLKGHD
jgi:Arc/MetJ-type ribon-helix-helix transcriptional regulator